MYFQPVDMKPLDMSGLPAVKAELYLEADVKVAKDNQPCYEKGSFLPYLTVKYEIAKVGGKTILMNSIGRKDWMPTVSSSGFV